MTKFGFDFPPLPRKTAISDLEEVWYLPYLSQKKNIPLQQIKKNNFGKLPYFRFG
jgi:hypothetical protein